MTLEQIFRTASQLLDMGISVIPVRSQQEERNGRIYKEKTPTIAAWKEYQKGLITKAKLYAELEKRIEDPAIAIITGAVSGSLEVIDIDEKHDPGISARYLGEIKEIYPTVFEKLRIHKTPSGGYHILYRCEELLTDGNRKLAVAKGKKEACLETRGEGGYVLAPPSMNYQVSQDRPIPVLSKAERNGLIELATLFDTRIKEAKSYTPRKVDKSYYSTNPWEDFNNSPEAERILLDFGWEFFKENNQYVHFTRPGKKGGVSASFIRETRMFYIFTSSTNLEPEKGYHPATILAQMQFAGDTKATYHALVEKGYGKIKPEVEKRIIQKAATKRTKLPANISEKAEKEFKQEVERINKNYPYGIFWTGDILEGFKISRQRLYYVAAGLGFSIRKDGEEIIYQNGHIAKKVDERFFFDTVKEYIKEEDPVVLDAIYDAYEAYLQRAGKFTISRLPVFNELKVLRDTKYTAFKFFNNCFLEISKKEIKINKYKSLNEQLIWEEEIQDRDFKKMDFSNCLYKQFIDKALEDPKHAEEVIGYLAHNYKDTTTAYIIVLTESVPDPKEGGGAGKNIFTDLFSLTTSVKDVGGEQVSFDENFLQPWNGERIYSLSDVPERFNFKFLKNVASNSAVLKKLFKDQETIKVEDLPKIIVSTNYSFEDTDGGLKRRLIQIEFTNFFTKQGGVDVYFDDKMFPHDWEEEDYLGYDNYIAHCIQKYLKKPKLKNAPISSGGWAKKFEQAFGKNTRLFIEEYWENWLFKGFVSNEDFEKNYSNYCMENGIRDRYKISSIKMNNALQEYCDYRKVEFEKGKVVKEMGITIRGRQFGYGQSEEKDPFQEITIHEELPFG